MNLSFIVFETRQIRKCGNKQIKSFESVDEDWFNKYFFRVENNGTFNSVASLNETIKHV